MCLCKVLLAGMAIVLGLVVGINLDKFLQLGNRCKMKNVGTSHLVQSLPHCATICSSLTTCIGFQFINTTFLCQMVDVKPDFNESSVQRNNYYDFTRSPGQLYQRGDCQIGEKSGPYCHHMIFGFTWKYTRTLCRRMGLDMAIVRNSIEMEHIFADLNSYPFRKHGTWLGAMSTDGTVATLTWSDGTALNYTYNTIACTSTERCLSIKPDLSGVWSWYCEACDSKKAGICERR